MAPSKASSIKKSLSMFKRHTDEKTKEIQDFIQKYAKLESMSQSHESMLNSLIDKLAQQLERYEKSWDEQFQPILDEDETEFDKYDHDLSDTKKAVRKTREDALDFISKFQSKSQTPAISTGAQARSTKIDDTFKPKEVLTRSMTLEEFNVWCDRFSAYVEQNQNILSEQSATVKREFLYNCIDASLTQALQTDSTITNETPITGDNSCTYRLKAIFLRDNPLFLRRYNFQMCVQKENESFPEFWARKLSKAKECELENIRREDVLLHELIRGVHDPKLKEEFLKQQNCSVGVGVI